VLASQEIIQDKKTKSGKNTQINLRDRLYELELEPTPSPSEEGEYERVAICGELCK
jgi:uncharacterized protein (DUF2344 family)